MQILVISNLHFGVREKNIDSRGRLCCTQLRDAGIRRKHDKTEDKKGRYWRDGGEYEYVPNGKFKLLLFNDYWRGPSKAISDTATKKLEDRLDEFF